MASKILINMSGHPLSEDARNAVTGRYTEIRDIAIPNVDIGDGSSMISFVKDVIKPLVSDNDVIAGNFDIILPGMAPLAAITLAAIHGVTGHFPSLLWLHRTANGFMPVPSPVDLQGVRETFRGFRTA